jgi:hypothetical protein
MNNKNLNLHKVHALAGEVVEYGEQEALLVIDERLARDVVDTLMKTNTFLTSYAMLLLDIVENSNIEFADKVMEVWGSEAVQEMAAYAFRNEIAEIKEQLDSAILEIENIVNENKE